MPHSSGGGSSGGGFHGGSSSGGGSSYRYSSRPFPGAICYVYYDSHHAPRLLYTNSDPAKAKRTNVFFFVLVGVFFLLPWAILPLIGNHNPQKIPTDYDHSIVLEDNNNVFSESEEAALNQKFVEFYEISGIAPSILTVKPSDWSGSSSLERFAYRKYLSFFEDERHWLFVYSSKENEPKTNWAWEGMQGDETDPVLSSKTLDVFNETLYGKLSDPSVSVADAFLSSFDAILPTMMDSYFYIDTPYWLFAGIWTAASAFMLASMIYSNSKAKQLKSAVKAPTDLSLKKCANCGNSYYAATVDKCPKCGLEVAYPRFATFPEENRTEFRKKDKPGD